MKPRSLVLTILALSVLRLSVLAGDSSMQLITHDIGWALDRGRLYWTNDVGNRWTDISPGSSAHLDDVFFLDATRGWTLLITTNESDVWRSRSRARMMEARFGPYCRLRSDEASASWTDAVGLTSSIRFMGGYFYTATAVQRLAGDAC